MTEDTSPTGQSSDQDNGTVAPAAADPSPISSPELPPAPDPDDLPYQPIPDNWLQYGHHPDVDRNSARLYAVEVLESTGEATLTIRYIHPVNDQAVRLQFDAIELDDGVVPKPAYQDFANPSSNTSSSLPVSLGIPGLTVTDRPAPEPAERQLLWALYGPFLLSQTQYRPPKEYINPTD